MSWGLPAPPGRVPQTPAEGLRPPAPPAEELQLFFMGPVEYNPQYARIHLCENFKCLF